MSISLLLIISFVFSFADFPSCFSADQQYEECRSPLTCGSGPSVFPNNITYPFWGSTIGKPSFCGQKEFELSCKNNETLTIEIDSFTRRVISVDLDGKRITVADESLFEGGCPKILDFKGDNQFSLNPPTTETIDLFNCTGNYPPTLSKITCQQSRESLITYHVFRSSNPHQNCTKVGETPILRSNKNDLNQSNGSNPTLKMALEKGFDLEYDLGDTTCRDCSNTGGICGSVSESGNFRCLCSDKPHLSSCNDEQVASAAIAAADDVDIMLRHLFACVLMDLRIMILAGMVITCKSTIFPVKARGNNVKLKVGIGAAAGVLGLTAASIFWFVYHRRKTKCYRTSSVLLPRNLSSDHPSSKSSDVEKAEELLVGVRLFSYEELEEATNSFDPSKELGDGGFGTVYYGKLKDGRSVAVKRLYDNNLKRAEQFRNEVEILTSLRHPNLVALFGCSAKQSRDLLLVYEYVANGTLADHLHGPQANPSSLPWFTRLKIAVETASALKYLHASKIIHRDVKSNNILLDQNFNVKVADFGLSRLFRLDQTHVSTAPQGTPGYVDPDYHLSYQLSNKSDVYSFAVVLMELISSLPAVDITRPRQEINLSNMAVVKIQSHKLQEMVDPSLGFDTSTKVRQTVIAVAELAFQCLQSDKDLRPCMTHVVETLTRIQNNGFGSEMDVADVSKSGPLVAQSPDSVIAKWDSK